MNAGKPKEKSNFQLYTDRPTNLFRFIGVAFNAEQRASERFTQIAVTVAYIVIIAHQLCYFTEPDTSERSANASYINYFVVSLGKYMAVLYNRRAMIQAHDKFRRCYPSAQVELRYDLAGHLQQYRRVEALLWYFWKYIYLFYNMLPLALTVYERWQSGLFVPHMLLPLWYPVPLSESVLEMVIYYIFQSTCSLIVALTISSCDLWLCCSLAQLCMHFDLTAKRILEVQPQQSQSLEQLKLIMSHHHDIVRLAAEINTIFTPSLIFSLLSSSFILCFTACQLLDDVSALFFFKLLLLMMYESKQVVVICYYGNRLMETSSYVFDASYEHNWHVGTLEYQRLVLFLLTITAKPVALMVPGIARISLIMLRQVFTMSYRIFTVLKTV